MKVSIILVFKKKNEKHELTMTWCCFSLMIQQVIVGLDRSLKKGEVAVLTIHPEYAFGLTKSHQES